MFGAGRHRGIDVRHQAVLYERAERLADELVAAAREMQITLTALRTEAAESNGTGRDNPNDRPA